MNEENNFSQTISEIQERNRRVEADKAWETSRLRISVIAGITYIIAACILFTIGIHNFLLYVYII